MSLVCTLLLGACTGEEEEVKAPVEPSITVNAELMEQSWVVRLTDDAQRKPFEGHPGWVDYFERSYRSSVSSMDTMGKVRLHAEYAALYRQAALLHAHATNHIYGTDRQEEDSPDTFYLRGVSKMLLGDTEGALADFALVTNPKLKERASQWLSFAEEKKEIQSWSISFPEVTEGGLPNPESIPHLTISTTIEGSTVGVTDATELWARARWHEKVAKALSSDSALVDLWIAPWRLPMENVAVDKKPALDDNWLFLSKYLVMEDAYFIEEIPQKGLEAVSVWKEKSLLASVLSNCIEGEAVNPEKVLDAAADLEQQMIARMKEKNQKEAPFYPIFADFSEQAVLQAGMFLADANNQSRDAGILRINAKDLVQTNSNDAIFQVSSAAWDVGNRYPLRAQDTIHYYSTEFPALRSVKQPMDALQIRLGKNSAAPGAAN